MKVALCTRSFRPEAGGLGSVAHSFAQELVRLNMQPFVITASKAPPCYDNQFSYKVIRAPNRKEFRNFLMQADCVVFIHLSVVYLAWSAFIPRPMVSNIQGIIWSRVSLLHVATSLIFAWHLLFRPHAALISRVVQSPATRRAPIIGNPFDGQVFYSKEVNPSPGTVIFSGRIVREKGIFDLVEATEILHRRGVMISVTFAGSGSGEEELKQTIQERNLEKTIRLAGCREPSEVAQLLREHQIAVIPSNWEEPFGIVALEAIACGCYVVAYPDGGLPEAVGQAGYLTASKTPEALASGIEKMLNTPGLREQIDLHRAEHLERFSQKAVVSKLLEVIDRARQKN